MPLWQPCLQNMRLSLSGLLPSVGSECSDAFYHSYAQVCDMRILRGRSGSGRHAAGSTQEQQRLHIASGRQYRERCCRVNYKHLARRRPWRAALDAGAA